MELLRDMALFVEVAKARSFSRAAAALGMPNSSLSRRISGLEKSIGLRLLNRTTRRTELTDAGQIYYERCRAIVEEAQQAHEQLRGVVDEPSGHLRVSMPVDFGVAYLAPLLVEFAGRYPGIRFDFDLSPRRVDILSEPFDVALRVGALPDSTLSARRIALIRAVLCAAPAYLRAAGDPANPAALAAHQCLRLRATPGETVWPLLRGDEKAEVRVDGRFAMNNIGLLQRLAVSGMGIALLAEDMVADDLRAGRLQRVLPEWHPPPIPVYALAASRLMPARARVFIDFLAERLPG